MLLSIPYVSHDMGKKSIAHNIKQESLKEIIRTVKGLIAQLDIGIRDAFSEGKDETCMKSAC